MSLYLIAESTSDLTGYFVFAWNVFLVAAGLGFVIFVHELGHFLVAKACGVKCEKFYIGFDVGGRKFWSRQWGETEYGIGVVPLGGYVKMLGQDDNPSNMAEENERAKLKNSEGESGDGEPNSDETTEELDPRSYMAKSVPQRMAIISAGVIMNLIFGFIFAAVAFRIGVPYTPAIVGDVIAGSSAWVGDLRPGDEFTEIDGRTDPWFRTLMSRVILFDQDRGLPITYQRPGEEADRKKTLFPNIVDGKPVPSIGVRSPSTLAFGKIPKIGYFSTLGLDVKEGDKITQINSQPITDHRELAGYLASHPNKPAKLTLSRPIKSEEDSKDSEPKEEIETETIEVTVNPRPMMRLGLIMGKPTVTAVQEGSPAADKAVQVGDELVELNGEPIGDPLTLPSRALLAGQSDQKIVLTVLRKSKPEDKGERVEIELPYRAPNSYESIASPGDPFVLPGLGLAYNVPNVIEEVLEGSSAAKAKIEPGEVIASAQFVESKKAKASEKEQSTAEKKLVKGLLEQKPIKFKDDQLNWPVLVSMIQLPAPGVELELTLKKGGKERKVTLVPEEASDLFWADRSLPTKPMKPTYVAENWSEAIRMGGRELWYSTTMVYRFLQKIGHQISPKLLGGPFTIAQVAFHSASESPGTLLVFLTMLSANLAVINFLPIPVLDGGHMVFLAWEGIFRKPMPEKIVIAFHMVGFAMIISLMLFVIGLDIFRLFGLT